MARGGRGGGGLRGGGGFRSSSSRSSRGFSSSSSSRGRSGRSSYRSSSFGSSGSHRSGMSSGPRPGGYRPHPRNSRPIMGGPIFMSTPRTTRRRTSGTGGCSSSLITVIVLVIFLIILFSMFSGGGDDYDYSGTADITSTVEREPLPSGSVNETGYFTDNLDWIHKTSALTSGMKTFYQETGVQPYLYLADQKEVLEYGGLQGLAEAAYDELFTDEAHFLFAFTEDQWGEWEIWFVIGTQATAVIDSEAEEIIYQYFVRYYSSDLEDEEFFSKVFEDSAKLMMKHETNGFDVAKTAIMVIGGAAVIGVVVYGVIKNKKIKLEAQKEQNEFTEKMMNVPLETFGQAQTDKELDELMKKYQDSEK